jgi:cellulose synthase/poly-beta-1,6-N-acetylglucosamine synthase-like glycosyltransferase
MTAVDSDHGSRGQVSVIVPVHNGVRYIEEALASILAQGPDLLEVIVMDNASTDGTSEILAAQSDARVHVVHKDELVPAWQNWSDACERARGTYTKVVCADDRLLPGALACQVDVLEKLPSALGAYGARRIITDSGRPFPLPSGGAPISGLRCWHEVLRESILSGGNTVGEPACVMFRTDALKACLPWSAEWSMLMDLEMYARVFHGAHVVGTAEPLAEFRLASNSWSRRLLGTQADEYSRWVESLRDRSLIELPAEEVAAARSAAARRERQRGVAYRIARGIEWCPESLHTLLRRVL